MTRIRFNKRKSRSRSPAVVYYTRARNETGAWQLCVFAECTYGGTRVGPVWGHTAAAVKRCLAQLTLFCGCGRPWHTHKFTEGFRVRT